MTPAKRLAYLATDYRVSTPTGPITLRIGEACPTMAAALRDGGWATAVFVTAWNPGGEAAEARANAAAQAQLRDELRAAGWSFWEGEGAAREPERHGEWPAEPSVLVLGMLRVAGRALAQAYGQDAVVFVDAAGMVELVEA